MCVRLLFSLIIAMAWVDSATLAQPSQLDLTVLSLEELMNVEVTSVAKKAQKVSATAAAVFVITQEDIRRAGVTSIPEALRLAPGLQVARIDANKWAISARGFSRRFTNNLLVLIDGRSVYTPLFSGVFWSQQDTLLEDVERIEVIRGPGAALWGANAVNGIINIITKSAQDTQGGVVTAGGGSDERGFAAVRYGAPLGGGAYGRIYVKYVNRDGFVDTEGNDTNDAWQALRGGFRVDWHASERDTLTVQGDAYDGKAGQTLTLPSFVAPFSQTTEDDTEIMGANVLARWQHTFSTASDLVLQLYYDRTDRDEFVFQESRDTFDLDFQHRFALGTRQEIMWGVGYRFTRDDFTSTSFIALDPDNRSDNLVSAFVQDEITLIEKRLRLTLGSKFEHNDYTGFEVQPNARLLWTPHAQHTIWAAVSHAVRTPSRVEDDVRLSLSVLPPGTLGPLPTLTVLLGDRDFDSEELLAYEFGYRLQPLDRLSVDIAAFYNRYNNLVSAEPMMPFVETIPAPARLVVPAMFGNKGEGETYGVELAADWRPLHWWRLRLAYSYLQIQLRVDDDSGDTTAEDAEGASPHHQVSLRSSVDLPWNAEFDVWVRYVDDLSRLLSTTPGFAPRVGRYVTLDVRLAWKPLKTLELAIVGQNLVESRHPEFIQELFPFPVEVERSVYGKVTWHF